MKSTVGTSLRLIPTVDFRRRASCGCARFMPLRQPLMRPPVTSCMASWIKRCRFVKIRLGAAVEARPARYPQCGFDFLRSIAEQNAGFGQFGSGICTMPRNLQMAERAIEALAEFREVHCILRSRSIGVSANGMPLNCRLEKYLIIPILWYKLSSCQSKRKRSHGKYGLPVPSYPSAENNFLLI